MAYTSIDNPELYFQTKLYTGTGSGLSATFDGDENMQPDLVWIKNRDDAENHMLYDSVRGTGKRIKPNDNSVEGDDGSDGVSAFNSDGFTIGTKAAINTSSEKCVAWCWKESADAGFDIVTYSGNATARDISHSLSAKPNIMIIKSRGNANSWVVGGDAIGSDANGTVYLDTTDTVASGDDNFGSGDGTEPTSSVFSIGSNTQVNRNSGTFVAYLWAEKQGFSKFGSYTGNGASGNGAFIYTGFRPAMVIYKNTASSYRWGMFDNKRSPHNLIDDLLYPDINNAESVGDARTVDFLSNGFKIRATGDILDINESGEKIIYMAWAEAPFVNSKGVPCNAR